MKQNTIDKDQAEKLVNSIPIVEADILLSDRLRLKRKYKIRRIADPHIRGHKVRGYVYYYYCRGTDREIYLGDADTILRAVKGGKK